jgi:hypothetical protein
LHEYQQSSHYFALFKASITAFLVKIVDSSIFNNKLPQEKQFLLMSPLIGASLVKQIK